MRLKSILAEFPQRIELPPDEFGLKNEKYNYKVANSILESSNKQLIESFPYNRNLYRYKNRFILIDENLTMVLYYLRWKDEFVNYLNMTVTTELLHWKNRGQYMFGLANLTRHVFFNLLLPLRGAVLSDSLHTSHNEFFWIRMIDEAFDKNLYVYYVNFLPVNSTTNREIVRLHDKYDMMNLVNNDKTPYGEHQKFQLRRFLILDKPQEFITIQPS